MNHNQKILEIKDNYERKGFQCQREFKIWRQDKNRWSKIDLCCFHARQNPRCFEVETNNQVLSNQEDLRIVKRTLGAKTCQLNINDNLSKCNIKRINNFNRLRRRF